eukprot:1828556-Amphidinium_carterae.1
MGGAMNRNLVPLTAGGLMHGTQVRFLPVAADSAKPRRCLSVRPRIDVPQDGLECGVHKEASEGCADCTGEVAAADIADLGFFAGVLDGRCGIDCAVHVASRLPALLHSVYTAKVAGLQGTMSAMGTAGEVDLIARALKESFLAADHDFMSVAQEKRWTDGASAVTALLAHGFEAAERQTVLGIEGGVAKVFVTWLGDSKAYLLRGSKARCLTKDHTPSRKDEYERVKAAGGKVLELGGILKVGRRDKYKAKKVAGAFEELLWSPTSRAFGDIRLKAPFQVVSSEPESTMHTLTPEDWALVLVSSAVSSALREDGIARICREQLLKEVPDPVEAARSLVSEAKRSGKANGSFTAFVLCFGWALQHVRQASST